MLKTLGWLAARERDASPAYMPARCTRESAVARSCLRVGCVATGAVGASAPLGCGVEQAPASAIESARGDPRARGMVLREVLLPRAASTIVVAAACRVSAAWAGVSRTVCVTVKAGDGVAQSELGVVEEVGIGP